MPDELQPPPPPDPTLASEAHKELALRMLYDEQARLRAELEQMRQKQGGGGEDKKGGGDKEGGDKKEGGADKEGGDKKEGGEEGGAKEGGDDKEKKEDKPPLKQRVPAWIKSHPISTVLLLILFLLLVLGAILLMHHLNSYEDTDDAFIDGHTDPISTRVAGYVRAIYVEDTFRVKKGQLLLELDARDNQVSKEQAVANYAQAQAGTRAQDPQVGITSVDQSTRVVNQDFGVVRAQANVAATEERYRSSEADMLQAQAQYENAHREEERYRLLVEKEEVSREQYDQRLYEEQADAAAVASRREQANAARRQVTDAEAQLGQAQQQSKQAREDQPRQVQAQREQLAQRKASELAAKAQADQAELNLEYTKIYAPEDGVIGDKQVQLAEQVAAGQELFALTQTNDIWVTANFKETQIQKMFKGQSVQVFVDALKLTFNGYVEALPGGTGAIYSLLPPENATGNYVKVVQRLPVRIRLWPNQPGEERLTPGMSVVPKVWLR